MSNKLEVIDRKIEEKSQEVALSPRPDIQGQLREELQKLKHNRDRLCKQREVLDAKLHDGTILTPQEERRSAIKTIKFTLFICNVKCLRMGCFS